MNNYVARIESISTGRRHVIAIPAESLLQATKYARTFGNVFGSLHRIPYGDEWEISISDAFIVEHTRDCSE